MYEHVTNDLFLAQEVLTQEGVICLDDMFNALWPEVAIAAFDWVRRTDNKFVPFLATKEKLFLCEPKYVPIYLAAIRADRELNGRMCRKISVLSHEVVVLSSSVASKMVDRVGRLFALSAGIVEGV
jgi:hypothetical protein